MESGYEVCISFRDLEKPRGQPYVRPSDQPVLPLAFQRKLADLEQRMEELPETQPRKPYGARGQHPTTEDAKSHGMNEVHSYADARDYKVV